jgi:hypothetical protein
MAVHICGSRRIWTVYRSPTDNGSDLSRPVCVVPISRLSALATCVQPLVHVSEPLSERTSAAQLHDLIRCLEYRTQRGLISPVSWDLPISAFLSLASYGTYSPCLPSLHSWA